MVTRAENENVNGLTFVRWLAAVGSPYTDETAASGGLRMAWLRGDDPSDWRVEFSNTLAAQKPHPDALRKAAERLAELADNLYRARKL